VKVTIDNQDTTNSIAYRISKQTNVNDLTAAPNGETIIENLLIEAFISLTPDAATGSGILSADLAWPADLVQLGWIPPGVVG
jgi:hypothetical protein